MLNRQATRVPAVISELRSVDGAAVPRWVACSTGQPILPGEAIGRLFEPMTAHPPAKRRRARAARKTTGQAAA
jgi:hypothetical protein